MESPGKEHSSYRILKIWVAKTIISYKLIYSMLYVWHFLFLTTLMLINFTVCNIAKIRFFGLLKRLAVFCVKSNVETRLIDFKTEIMRLFDTVPKS